MVPATVVFILRVSDLQLELREYRTGSRIGGRFWTRYPMAIWGNLNAVHRGACEMACVFVHEVVHAVSWDTADHSFSHDSDDDHDHGNTAPYWIQHQLRRRHCGTGLEEPLEVEMVEGDSDEDLESDPGTLQKR